MTIQISNTTLPDNNSLTTIRYAKLKLEAIAEIEETTKKGKQLLNDAVIDKTTAIVDL